MKKAVCINPVDDEMELLANSIKILNEYKKLGFVTRNSFVEMIMDEYKNYHNLEGMKKLNNFWAGRVKDQGLNDDLLRIIDNMKTS